MGGHSSTFLQPCGGGAARPLHITVALAAGLEITASVSVMFIQTLLGFPYGTIFERVGWHCTSRSCCLASLAADGVVCDVGLFSLDLSVP